MKIKKKKVTEYYVYFIATHKKTHKSVHIKRVLWVEKKLKEMDAEEFDTTFTEHAMDQLKKVGEANPKEWAVYILNVIELKTHKVEIKP